MKITIVAGARPNFMKIAPLIRQIKNRQEQRSDIHFRLVHTGQHYDAALSDVFFEQLHIPKPDVNFNVGSGSQAEQTAAILIAFEKELIENPCDLVLVVGDVTSTMSCAITAKKMGVKVAHVEAGIRSGDWTMPEEINRKVTDCLTDLHFTTSVSASENLLREGVNPQQIHFVGNVMIDSLLHSKPNFKAPDWFAEANLESGKYILLTLHRPSNVDNGDQLVHTLRTIEQIASERVVLFPIHPRTKHVLGSKINEFKRIYFTSPQPYLEFMWLVQNSSCVITDSGGLSEETTVLGIKCFTLRNSTERPETIEIGTNTLVGTDLNVLSKAYTSFLKNGLGTHGIPELWDGRAAERILEIILRENA
ncbi:non-hydrolyzing UDP-N-acetylglucosamine 2-epimerase [Flavobacterium aurantiibacter]|uniref:UDP-N-acetylglucosamine 2-epimerase (Non-hydrolyzing) n=1 Tax=Flavobacterium aurantiibacter TaxID=2023067 RepID=A0A255ZJ75_9FLAO|nr:UDP-N-acetylglucosamine 2-epimerase (non-hydrolyzing) [Flavobacterium aurantiibacter]OYQ41568.1 UDP-N-acetylglucosamine 2-epimerase (non-hydrolyzing) [Flavobacterium aurantiibacter]